MRWKKIVHRTCLGVQGRRKAHTELPHPRNVEVYLNKCKTLQINGNLRQRLCHSVYARACMSVCVCVWSGSVSYNTICAVFGKTQRNQMLETGCGLVSFYQNRARWFLHTGLFLGRICVWSQPDMAIQNQIGSGLVSHSMIQAVLGRTEPNWNDCWKVEWEAQTGMCRWSAPTFENYCGHARVKGNDRADRLAGKATPTSGLLLRRSEVLKSSRHYLRAQSQGHHETTNRLEERGVERGSARRSSLKGQERVIINQTVQTLEPFQRQRWGNFRERGGSTYNDRLFQRIDTTLKWTEPNRVRETGSGTVLFCRNRARWFLHWHRRASGLDPFGQNPTWSDITKSDLGRFCTAWSEPSVAYGRTEPAKAALWKLLRDRRKHI